MKFLLPLFLCSSLFAQNITNLYVGQQLSVGMQLTTVPSAGSSYTNVVNGIVGWWKFDEGTGLVALDSSGNLNVGTINGGSSYVTGKVGPYALSFDGSSGYVSDHSFNTSFIKTTPFSGTAWINTTNTSFQEIICNWNFPTNPGWDWDISDLAANKICFFIANADAGLIRGKYGATAVNDGKWHHIAFTYDGSNTAAGIKLYVDGNADSLTTLQDADPGTLVNNSFEIGKRNGGIEGYFNGSIDDVRIYNRALSAGEVLDLYNFTK